MRKSRNPPSSWSHSSSCHIDDLKFEHVRDSIRHCLFFCHVAQTPTANQFCHICETSRVLAEQPSSVVHTEALFHLWGVIEGNRILLSVACTQAARYAGPQGMLDKRYAAQPCSIPFFCRHSLGQLCCCCSHSSCSRDLCLSGSGSSKFVKGRSEQVSLVGTTTNWISARRRRRRQN